MTFCRNKRSTVFKPGVHELYTFITSLIHSNITFRYNATTRTIAIESKDDEDTRALNICADMQFRPLTKMDGLEFRRFIAVK